MCEPILTVMAAGLGSRYGGLKQIDPVGRNGEILIDFGLYDAIRAGFKRVIFIISHTMEKEFKEVIGNRISKIMEVNYAYQELNDIPSGYIVPPERIKPWGTGHALLCCRGLLDAPFAVINADDFYGHAAFREIYKFLKCAKDTEQYQYAMVGYVLENTLAEYGHVSRGACAVKDGILQSVTELTHVEKCDRGALYTEDGQNFINISPKSIVSMNFWGFTPSFINELEHQFPFFLDKALQQDPLKAEFFLPTAVNCIVQNGRACVRVLSSPDKWYGMTYHSDKALVVNAINRMINAGDYPAILWA